MQRRRAGVVVSLIVCTWTTCKIGFWQEPIISSRRLADEVPTWWHMVPAMPDVLHFKFTSMVKPKTWLPAFVLGDYKLGVAGSADCPQGTTPIGSRKACAVAAGAVRGNWMGNAPPVWTDRPQGCMMFTEEAHNIYFMQAGVTHGSVGSDVRTICASETTMEETVRRQNFWLDVILSNVVLACCFYELLCRLRMLITAVQRPEGYSEVSQHDDDSGMVSPSISGVLNSKNNIVHPRCFVAFHLVYHLMCISLVTIAVGHNWLDLDFGLQWELWFFWLNWNLLDLFLQTCMRCIVFTYRQLQETVAEKCLRAVIPGLSDRTDTFCDWVFTGLCIEFYIQEGQVFDLVLGVVSILIMGGSYGMIYWNVVFREDMRDDFCFLLTIRDPDAVTPMRAFHPERFLLFIQQQGVQFSKPWKQRLGLTGEIPLVLLKLLFAHYHVDALFVWVTLGLQVLKFLLIMVIHKCWAAKGSEMQLLKKITYSDNDVASKAMRALLAVGKTHKSKKNQVTIAKRISAESPLHSHLWVDDVQWLVKTGRSDGTELLALGLKPLKLQEAGFSLKDLKTAGAKVPDFVPNGARVKGCSAKELLDAGYEVKEMKLAGFTAGELEGAGCDSVKLVAAGFTLFEMQMAGVKGLKAKKFLDKGIKVAILKQAGFTAEELSEAGCSVEQLKQTGFTALELLPAYGKTEHYTQEELVDVFDQFDDDRSGQIDLIELGKVLSMLGMSETKKKTKKLLDLFDKDGDGTVSKPEFVNLFAGQPRSSSLQVIMKRAMIAMLYGQNDLADVFDQIDVDNSGHIDFVELGKALKMLDINSEKATTKKLLEVIDKDGDGTISRQEFVDFFEGQHKATNLQDILKRVLSKLETQE